MVATGRDHQSGVRSPHSKPDALCFHQTVLSPGCRRPGFFFHSPGDGPGFVGLRLLTTSRLIVLAIIDARLSQLPKGVRITREFSGRFAVGAENEVHINVQNAQPDAVSLEVKDEYPPQMKLSGLREAHLRVDGQTSAALVYGLTPPKRGRFEFGQSLFASCRV